MLEFLHFFMIFRNVFETCKKRYLLRNHLFQLFFDFEFIFAFKSSKIYLFICITWPYIFCCFRNMEVGKKEAIKFIRKTIDIQEGQKCECGRLVCPDQQPRECLNHFMILESKKVAEYLFKLYQESVFGTLTNQSVWVDSMGGRISRKKLIHIKDYEPDCGREIDGRKCVDGNVWQNEPNGFNTGNEIIFPIESTAKVKCQDLCNYCELNYNYTVSTAIEEVDCNCEPKLNPETLQIHLTCNRCFAVVHSCRSP